MHRKEILTMAEQQPLQPTAPRHLKKEARSMYEKLVPILSQRGTTNISQSVLEQYSMTYRISRLAYQDIEEHGLVNEATGKKNPNVATYENAVKNIRALGNDLGLSPASQVAIQKLIIESDNDDENESLSFKERVDNMKF